MPFSSLGLSDSLLRAVAHHSTPTPVQAAAIPAVLEGRDLLATAQTGSGKTLAFTLPLVQRWLRDSRSSPRMLHTLILVPTRELATQVTAVLRGLTRDLPDRAKAITAVGGVSINPQMMALRGGTDFLVATPGRLLDLVDHNAVSLACVKALALDEADRLLDLGFADELQRLLKMLPRTRQTLLFSATMPAPVEALANDLLRDPLRVRIEAPELSQPMIVQRAIEVDKDKRSPLLRHLLKTEDWKRVLAFVATRYASDHVADKLRRHGIPALSLHGDLSQGARAQVLEDFKDSSFRVLVATDLAARGLDIAHLPVVLNYDLPRSAIDFTHRIGRTGRAGESGLAVSFITAESHAHFCGIEMRSHLRIPREHIPGFEPQDTPPPPRPGTGGIKGRRKSKKDKLREAAARAHAPETGLG